jgi:5-methyltetrahydropteroyltriglutamate--homocysteine methyltransferase
MPSEIQLSGILPRSEKLIELTRSYERAKTGWDQVETQLGTETKEILNLQESLGSKHVSDGAISWQDQLRPIARSLTGVELGTRYSRWFDTNTFYQKPVIVGKISARPIDPKDFVRSELLSGNWNRKITLPGPYTFSQLSENKYYSKYSDLVQDVALAERDIISRLRAAGISLFQLAEPCLVYQPYRESFGDNSEIRLALDSIRSLVRDNPNEFVVQTYFGDAGPVINELLSLPVGGIGVDLFETDAFSINGKSSRRLVLGVVDARESFVEDPRWVADTAKKFCENANYHDVVLSSNSDLKFVPQSIATRKLEALSAASRLIEGAL